MASSLADLEEWGASEEAEFASFVSSLQNDTADASQYIHDDFALNADE